MMEVRPFKAFRFNKDVVGDPADCIAPPYDVIDSRQQEQLYSKSDYNIVRVIKGMKKPEDNETENEYTRAADYLNKWIDQGAVKQEDSEAIYGYVQNFKIDGRAFQRLTFVCLAKLEEFGQTVRAHEQILKKPILDRLTLKRAAGAKFGLVFMIYKDQKCIADKIIEKAATQTPLIDLVDEQDVRHRLFAITDKKDTDAISAMMSDKSCIIADGHHRYTTGLTYMKENPDNPAAKYQMTAFVNTCHEGLIVLATHRVVNNLSDFDPAKLVAELEKNFELTEYAYDTAEQEQQARQQMLDKMRAEFRNNGNVIGIHTKGKSFYTAVLKEATAMDSAAPGMSQAWKSLDVSVLHKLILEDLLGIDEEKLTAGGYVEYVKDSDNKVEELICDVDSDKKQVAFFMNPPRIEQIEAVADEGERMPQKSTYFYPKIFTGLTINKL
ncbi:MAG: DUF1015 domain-containing protein [Planctomycetota bacterium]|jgi:uncharacterized protein (DUF1015 family)